MHFKISQHEWKDSQDFDKEDYRVFLGHRGSKNYKTDNG